MPRRLGVGTLLIPISKENLELLCHEKGLTEYETEIILRIYWKRQSLNFIADDMEFDQYGKAQKYYSVRSINNFHKEAFAKIIR